MKENIIKVFISLALVMCLGMGTTFGDAANVSVSDNYSRVARASVQIIVPSKEDPTRWTAQGSGICVNFNNGVGYVVTCDHVIVERETPVVNGIFYGQKTLVKMDVVKENKEKDIAILKFTAPNDGSIPSIKMRYSSLVLGENVFLVGNPSGYGLALYKGYISRVFPETVFGHDTLRIGMLGTGGMSGAGVCDENGDIVGILEGVMSHRNGAESPTPTLVTFIIPSSDLINYCREFL